MTNQLPLFSISNPKGIKPEAFEEVKRKLAGRIVELEGQLENILSKCLGLEKIKSHLQAELDSTAAEVEKVGGLMGEKVGGLMGGIGGWLVGGTGGWLVGGTGGWNDGWKCWSERMKE